MKRRKLTLLEYSLLAIPLIGFVLVSFDGVQSLREIWNPNADQYRATCQAQLAYSIGLSLRQYTQDYDGKLPPNRDAGLGQGGWVDGLRSYRRITYNNFKCPARIDDARNSFKPEPSTDYWFNANLVGLTVDKFEEPALVISGADGDFGQPLNYVLRSVPPAWLHDKRSPAQRHKGGANYLFLDGHVKWLKPEEVSDARKNWWTFKPAIVTATSESP